MQNKVLQSCICSNTNVDSFFFLLLPHLALLFCFILFFNHTNRLDKITDPHPIYGFSVLPWACYAGIKFKTSNGFCRCPNWLLFQTPDRLLCCPSNWLLAIILFFPHELNLGNHFCVWRSSISEFHKEMVLLPAPPDC